jgi:chemotaxis regulatin CheY-phosphate phosphatase CheZ
MSNIVCVRVSRELKEKMKKFHNINWSELIRRFIEETISRLEAEELIRKIKNDLRDVPTLSSDTVSRWIRADRDSH